MMSPSGQGNVKMLKATRSKEKSVVQNNGNKAKDFQTPLELRFIAAQINLSSSRQRLLKQILDEPQSLRQVTRTEILQPMGLRLPKVEMLLQLRLSPISICVLPNDLQSVNESNCSCCSSFSMFLTGKIRRQFKLCKTLPDNLSARQLRFCPDVKDNSVSDLNSKL